MSKTWGFFLVAQDMVLSHHAKFQLTVKPRFNGQMRTNDSPLLEKVR